MSTPPSIGPYRVVREIARGGMGAVYEVLAPSGQRVALKTIAVEGAGQDELARFEREAQLMARVRHPNLIQIFAFERPSAGQAYIVCELVEGENLRDLARRGPVELRRAATIVRDLAAGLEALHAAGILHRDLKPENVILRPDGSPLLLDFGIAREADSQTLTQEGGLLGTPGFMSPEQAEGLPFRELSVPVDVYGLAAILYYLIAGRPPFEGATLASVLIATTNTPVDLAPLGELPPSLQEAIWRGLQKDPAARQRTARDFAQDLDAFLTGPPERPRSRALPAALALALLLGIAGVGAWAATRPGGPRPSPSATSSATPSPTPIASAPIVVKGLIRALPRMHPAGPIDGSSRVAFAGNELLLQCCQHAPALRYVTDSDWSSDEQLEGKTPLGVMAFEPASGTHVPVMGVGLRSVGRYHAIRSSPPALGYEPIVLRDTFQNMLGKADRLEGIQGRAVTALHTRTSDGRLLTGVAAEGPEPEAVRVFRLTWQREDFGIRDLKDGLALKRAPLEPRAITNLIHGTSVAVGRLGSARSPIRVWWIAPSMRPTHDWPPAGAELPQAAGTATVGVTVGPKRFVFWGDVEGGLHLVRWEGDVTKDHELKPVTTPELRRRVARLPGPIAGLAIAGRRREILLVAASGEAAESSWEDSQRNQLVVWRFDPDAETLDEVTRVEDRPGAYTWLAVTADAETLALARADCSVELWDLAELAPPR